MSECPSRPTSSCALVSRGTMGILWRQHGQNHSPSSSASIASRCTYMVGEIRVRVWGGKRRDSLSGVWIFKGNETSGT